MRRAAGAVAVGLALTGCPADDGDPESETINSAAAYGVEETISDTDDPSVSGSDTEGSSSSSGGSEEGDTEAGSGSSSSSSGGATDTEDTDPGSTSVSPDYGVPTTG